MVSLITFLLNLIKREKVVKIRRFPPAKVIRAHLAGLTFGFIASLLAIAIHYPDLFAQHPWYVPVLLSIGFALGTLIGGVFVLLVFLDFLLFRWLGGTVAGLYGLVHTMADGYMWGYFAGAVFGTLYNDLVYLYLISFGRDRVKHVFWFDRKRKLNVLKSPILSEEPAGLNRLGARKLYRFDISSPPEHPFTIAFVANPKILKRGGDPAKDDDYEIDPIIKNLDLFLNSVHEALFQFERDAVLGRPEVWSRVRILAVFDEQLAAAPGPEVGLLQPAQNLPAFDGQVAENLLDPMEQMLDNYGRILHRFETESGTSSADIDRLIYDTDVIFALSAVPEYDRSTAHFTDWRESVASDPNRDPDEVKFEYSPDPHGTKGEEILFPEPGDDRFAYLHEDFAVFPGRVALNVLGANCKTWLHEFAHAMSSAYHGAIVDEYFDRMEVSNGTSGASALEPEETAFFTNRIERNSAGKAVVPVHDIYARYNSIDYPADLHHPSAEEDWIGYFPVRELPASACTMDRNYGEHRFDALLCRFMYDRLVTKINR